MPNLKALAELARAATPGPWRHDPRGEASGFEHVFVGLPDGPGQTIAQWTLPYDAAYIAAASPDVVLKLIAVAEAAKAWAESDECDKFLPNKRREQGILDALEDLEK